MINLHELINKPGYGQANQTVMAEKEWDYDYPVWFIDKVQEITGVELTEHQRTDMIKVYSDILDGYDEY